AVIDPERYTDRYLEYARNKNLKITHIIETHLHADFVSGHMELAEKTKAKIYSPADAECDYEHLPIKEGDKIELEDLIFEAIATPGHTPEHISYILTDTSRADKPVAVFCGDTLFVGDVGRPDLFPGRAEELGKKLFDSLHDKLMSLSDYVEVYPLHGEGSMCGKAIGAKKHSTIGYENRFNKILQNKSQEKFMEQLMEGMPPIPDHYSRCTRINKKGPELIANTPFPCRTSPKEFNEMMQRNDTTILDIRRFQAFAGAHIPNSYNIDLETNFPAYAGWVLPPDKKIMIVSDSFEEVKEAVAMLKRVGLDNTFAYLEGGIYAWGIAGLPHSHISLIDSDKLRDIAHSNNGKTKILDVRSPSEFEKGHIDGAININFPDLRERYKELNKRQKYVVVCGSGQRASIAISILKQHGFKNLLNVNGGITVY
ncbi:MAG: MBL fold metallo-hydrolase, partial [Vulcanimicrobiota bacterium]